MSLGKYIKAQADPWVRPADWLPIDHLVTTSDEKFVALTAVYPDQLNIEAFVCAVNYTVNWGDGTITNHAAYSTADHQYDYSSISNSTLTSEGFKQVIIQIYPQSGAWTGGFTMGADSTFKPIRTNSRMVDIRMSAPNITSFSWTRRFTSLVKFNFLGAHKPFSLTSMFTCSKLKWFYIDWSNISGNLGSCFAYTTGPFVNAQDLILNNNLITTIDYMLETASAFKTVLIDLPNCTTSLGLLNSSSSVETIHHINLPLVTGAFNITNAYNLKNIGYINLPLATSFGMGYLRNLESVGTITCTSATSIGASRNNLVKALNFVTSSTLTSLFDAFNICRSLETLTISNCSSVTNTTGTLNNCNSLKSLILTGLTRGITIPPCQMDETAFINFFNSLGTAAGAQTIVITGNITLLPSTIAIATGKGFTITP